MMRIAVDTNVILDYLLDRKNAPQNERLFELAAAGSIEVYLSLPVVLECEWVLRTAYKKTKPDVVRALRFNHNLASLSDIPLPTINEAIELYATSRAVNFSDCLIVVLSAGATIDQFITGDRKLAKLYQRLKKGKR